MTDLLAAAVLPAALRPGDRIGVCAPAGPCRADRLKTGLARLEERAPLRLGSIVQRSLEQTNIGGYLSAPDDERIDEFMTLLRDPDVRAIVVARGGYGITRILPALDSDVLRNDPRPIVGFSDATALMSWALHAGVRPIHGPMALQFGELGDVDVTWLWRMLTDVAPAGSLPEAGTLPSIGRVASTISGRVTGGNLTLLAALCGTPWAMPMHDGIVALEEIGEKPYAIDRDLTQLFLSGSLSTVRGAIVGEFLRCTDPAWRGDGNDDDGPALATVDERLAAFGIAGVKHVAFGHGKRNLALPIGARAIIDIDAGSITLLDAAVA